MVAYTTYIPKEFLLGKLQLSFVLAFLILIIIIVYFGYRIHKITKIKKRPEEFR